MGFMRSYVGRRSLAILAALFIWLGATAPTLADLHIVTSHEEGREDTYYKGSRVAVAEPNGTRIIIDCDTTEFTMIFPSSERRYWSGRIDDLVGQFEEAWGQVMDQVPAGFFDDFADMFGFTNEPSEIRITRVGSDTVAGYQADHYRVETLENGTWQTEEELWVSPALMREIEAEVGPCMRELATDILATVSEIFLVGFDGMPGALDSPEYLELLESGYPVRTRSIIQFFGMQFDTVTEVTEVNKGPVSDEHFQIPAGYERIENFGDLVSDF